jgi:hypothetical protein
MLHCNAELPPATLGVDIGKNTFHLVGQLGGILHP